MSILGLALSLLFKKTCTGDRCTLIKGAPLAEVQGKTFRFGKSSDCFTFSPFLVKCAAAETPQTYTNLEK